MLRSREIVERRRRGYRVDCTRCTIVAAMTAAEKLAMTYAEYLALERDTDVRHEFVDGVAYAMAGGTPSHSRLAAMATVALGGLLRASRGRCRVYNSDGKIHVLARGNSHYPDVSVVCGRLETAPDDPNAITNPTLVVEVLSEGTELYDRTRKFQSYQRIPSLRHYILIVQGARQVEHYRRNDDETWTYAVATAGGAVQLPDLGGAITVDELYEGEDQE